MVVAKVSVSDHKVQWLRQRPHLCAFPYIRNDFRMHGGGFKASCCCNLDVSYTDKIGTTDLVDEVREYSEQGRTHPACWRCHDEEKGGHISERIRGLMYYDLGKSEKIDDTVITHPNFEIGMKFSNFCNLGCRSCDSYDSSTFSKITGRELFDQRLAEDLSDMPEHWNVLLEQIRIQSQKDQELAIHPIGGETFVQKGFYRLLDWLVEENIAHKTVIRVTTSLATIISDELADRFKKFKRVELLASIDSVGENYHHVRWPAKFEKVERNLEIVTVLNREFPKKFLTLGVMPTFSLNNIFYLPEILDFWTRWSQDNKMGVYMNTMHLYRPNFLTIDILPLQYRQQLISVLKDCQNHQYFDPTAENTVSHTIVDYIKATLEILESRAGIDEELFQDYLKFSADYDRRTGSDSFHGNKKLFDLLDTQHKQIYHQHYDQVNLTIPIYYGNA